MAQKLMVLLLDGTWKDQDSGSIDTNIVRMQEIINKSLSSKPAVSQSSHKLVAGRCFKKEGQEYLVFYQRGVGTGAFDRYSGGAFGEGLSENIRRAYKFLSRYYEDGDQIFIFGFSRGAYTARSLVGYIAAAGLLKGDHCTPEWEAKAWAYYRTSPNDRFPGLLSQLQPYMNDRDKLKIECVGVFDTVGALGIPLTLFRRLNREKYEFHNVELSAITKVNLHAMAIDEHRYPFAATLWRKPKFKGFNTKTEQVWFPGAHSDVGGGYVPDELRQCSYQHALDDIALDWMLRRLHFYFEDDFPVDLKVWRQLSSSWAMAPQHEPRDWFFKFWRFALRAIANYGFLVDRWHFEEIVSLDRRAEVIGEMVHISALQRLGENVSIGRRQSQYRPKNLVALIDKIRATYTNEPLDREIKVVDWNGTPFNPKNATHCSKVLALIECADRRLSKFASS